ncbi:MAG: O-methyltransferase [Kiritimatiellae bacterium]|nr:O-methyltransferase [Kiritimatiellia bacterium]
MSLSQEERVMGYDAYITELCAKEDEALRGARKRAEKAGLPAIAVPASEGKLLHVLVRSINAKRILEIGTLGGYSAIWMARALPSDGKLISLELEQRHAEIATENLKQAGLSDRVEIRVGAALDSLATMRTANEPLFDVVFIDADKSGYLDYLKAALPLLRVGGLMLADNTLSDIVLDRTNHERTKPYCAAAAAHPALLSVITPALRDDHIDGLMISLKISDAQG